MALALSRPFALPRFGGSLLSFLLRMDAVARDRARLAQMDAHLLADIGLTHQAAQAEAARAPWDLSLPLR